MFWQNCRPVLLCLGRSVWRGAQDVLVVEHRESGEMENSYVVRCTGCSGRTKHKEYVDNWRRRHRHSSTLLYHSEHGACNNLLILLCRCRFYCLDKGPDY